MPRHITPADALDLQSEASPHALLAFVTIRHPNLTEPIRAVADPFDYLVTEDGQTHLYRGLPFEIRPPTDSDREPVTQMRVPNVTPLIGEAIRESSVRAQVSLAVRSTADFNLSQSPRVELAVRAPIYSFAHFELTDVEADMLELSGTLSLRDYAQEPWPSTRATEGRCPALFR